MWGGRERGREGLREGLREGWRREKEREWEVEGGEGEGIGKKPWGLKYATLFDF